MHPNLCARIIMFKENKFYEIINADCANELTKAWEWLLNLIEMIPKEIPEHNRPDFLFHFLSTLETEKRFQKIDPLRDQAFIASKYAFIDDFEVDKSSHLVENKIDFHEDPLFGKPNGRPIENVKDIFEKINQGQIFFFSLFFFLLDCFFSSDHFSAEILLSFGTSTMGSSGHLGLCVRDLDDKDDKQIVYSANFNADKKDVHKEGYYTDGFFFLLFINLFFNLFSELVMKIPKMEYLYGLESSISPLATFGLDYGECFKRSVLGIRIYGFSKPQIEKIHKFYQTMNTDYQNGIKKTNYNKGEIKYKYTDLNCAKTAAEALRFGVGKIQV